MLTDERKWEIVEMFLDISTIENKEQRRTKFVKVFPNGISKEESDFLNEKHDFVPDILNSFTEKL